MRNLILILFATAGLFFAGCSMSAGQVEAILEGKEFCECKEEFDLPEIVHIADSFYIRGDGQIEIPDEDINESYGIKMFYQPPSFVYIQGDHLLMGKAILAGGNTDKFWFWIRHNEVDAYWYGRWDFGCMTGSANLPINPSIILEAMGLLYCGQDYQRYGCTCNAYVFNRFLPDGSEKRIWFDCCDEKLRKIEVFDKTGQLILLCKVKSYRTISNGYEMPTLLEIQLYSETKIAGKAKIKFDIDTFKVRQYSEKFHESFFTRPEPKGAKHVYKMLADGRFIKVESD